MRLIYVEDSSAYLTPGDEYTALDSRTRSEYEHLIECDDGRERWYPAAWFNIK